MFWLLLGLVVLLSLVVLAVTLLALWKRVKVLGSQVSAVGETVDTASRALESARDAGPLGLQPCPTCGHRPPLVGGRSPQVRAEGAHRQ